MNNILLGGHSGSTNRGCEAIVRSTCDILAAMGDMHISLFSRDVESDIEVGLDKIDNLSLLRTSPKNYKRYSFDWLCEVIDRRVIRKVFQGYPSYYSLKHRNIFKNMDIFMSIGGDNFSDDYGVPSHYFGSLYLAKMYGLRTVIWGASVGPFQDKRLEDLWMKRLRSVDLITVREDKTLDYLKSMGVIANVRMVSDPAFLLRKECFDMSFLNRHKGKVIVGIGMSSLISRYDVKYEAYIKNFFAFINKILKQGDAAVILIPHVMDKVNNNDDYVVCEDLFDQLDSPQLVTIADRELNACQLKYVISECDVFFGARTHSTIASLSSFVPTISLAYSAKAYGINKDIFGHTNYVIPISDITEDKLWGSYGVLLKGRDSISEELRKRIPSIQKQAMRGCEYLREMISRGNEGGLNGKN